MSNWTANDSAAESPDWTPSLVQLEPNTANRDAMFGNSTADAFITNETVGVYGVAENEIGYDTWELIGATPGSNAGVSVLITANATTQFQVNGGTASVNAIINVESLKVSTYGINAAGQAYVNGDIIQLDEGEGTAAKFSVTANATGNVTAITLISPGYYANASDLPSAESNTANVTGSGNSLVLDITLGAETLSLATNGTFTALPGAVDDNIVTADADQTGSGATLNLVFRKSNPAQGVAHGGWVLVRDGTGGRAGRVDTEVLVANRMTGDAEDTKFANT